MNLAAALREIFGSLDDIRHNLATGAICRVNLAIGAIGSGTTLVTEDGAKIFAALATGVWFATQTVLAIVAYARKHRWKG